MSGCRPHLGAIHAPAWERTCPRPLGSVEANRERELSTAAFNRTFKERRFENRDWRGVGKVRARTMGSAYWIVVGVCAVVTLAALQRSLFNPACAQLCLTVGSAASDPRRVEEGRGIKHSYRRPTRFPPRSSNRTCPFRASGFPTGFTAAPTVASPHSRAPSRVPRIISLRVATQLDRKFPETTWCC